MDWANERYVRLYCRVTVDESLWPFEAQALWPQLMRRADRAGVIDLGKHGADKAVAALLHWPVDFVATGLAALLEDGCIALAGSQLVIPNYIPANETPSSDAQRAKEYRARKALEAVTSRHEPLQNVTRESQNVTDPSRAVTPRHSASLRADPSVPSVQASKSEPASQPPIEIETPDDWPIEPQEVMHAWHRALNAPDASPGLVHALHLWSRDYETIAGVLTALPGRERRIALNALCEWFWLAPDGPIQSGRVARTRGKPSHLAKHVSTDIEAAKVWFLSQPRKPPST